MQTINIYVFLNLTFNTGMLNLYSFSTHSSKSLYITTFFVLNFGFFFFFFNAIKLLLYDNSQLYIPSNKYFMGKMKGDNSNILYPKIDPIDIKE